MREQINSLERHVKSTVPFVFSELDHIFADGDARAVTQDVDLAPLLDDGLYGLTAVGCFAHVALQSQAFPAVVYDFVRSVLGRRLVNIKDGDRSSHLSETESNPASDAGCSAAHDRNFAVERKKLGRAHADCGGSAHARDLAAASRALPAASIVRSTSFSVWASVTMECNAAEGEA